MHELFYFTIPFFYFINSMLNLFFYFFISKEQYPINLW